jgi:uncharacterized membrane protein YcaP (DUF421 family)
MFDLDEITRALTFLFGGDFPGERPEVHQVAARAVVVYLAGLAIIRLGKSRGLGRFTPLDVLMGFLLGSLLSRGITGNASMSGTVASSAALVAVHWLLTRLAWQWHWFGNLVKGHADVIVRDGQPLDESMKRHHITQHDLDEFLRDKGIDDVSTVRLAYKERSGGVSAIPKKALPRVLEVAVESGVQTVRIVVE